MENRAKGGKVGSVAFYFSLLTLFVLSAVNIANLVRLNYILSNWPAWLPFLIGLLVGALIATKFVRGKTSVFLHELKHAIISNLVGNKWKSLVVQNRTGHFEYAYSDKTSRFNAFVALAPYCLPIFTIVGGGICFILTYNHRFLLPRLVSLFYGIDLILNTRDISPVQTDISGIRGGFHIGLAYIIAANLFIFTMIGAWITDGQDGVRFLFVELARQFKYLITGA